MLPEVDLLIVGTSIDSHIQAVLDRLPDYVSYCRLDIDKFPQAVRLSAHFSSSLKVVVEDGRDAFDISAPSVVWFRRIGALGVSESIPAKYRQFCLQEAEHTLIGALSTISPKRWINEYWATKRAANKLVQYSLAREVGLLTPDTLVSNSVGETRKWIDANEKSISKSIQSPLIVSNPAHAAFSFTSRTPSQSLILDAEIEATPCQYQPFIEKAYELRVTSIAGRHHAVRIDTPENVEDDLDWRTSDCTYTTFRLDNKTGKLLSELMVRLGLDYGASDFTVTTNGEVVFLEINPHGAWRWLEDRLPGYDFTQDMCSEIVNCIVE